MKIRHSARPLGLARVLLLLGLGLHPATAQLLGPEFQVNASTLSSQSSPAVAADGAGNFVVAWHIDGPPGSGFGDVFGQRFGVGGSPVGSEFLVNTYTTNHQLTPAIAADGSGNFVATWNSLNQDGSSYGVFGQRFDSAGARVGNEFKVNTYTWGAQRDPAVAADGLGNFVVVWGSYGQDASSWGVFGQRFDSTGSPLGSEFQANSYTLGIQYHPAVAADGSGNFVVVWASSDQDGSQMGVFAQRFDPAGAKAGSEFQVNTYTTNHQALSKVAAIGSGNFVVVWGSYGQDGSNAGLFGQRFNAVGNAVGSEFQVNSYTTGIQTMHAVAADASGNFIAAWRGSDPAVLNGDVFGRRLSNWILIDDFEAGDACSWSGTVGGGCP